MFTVPHHGPIVVERTGDMFLVESRGTEGFPVVALYGTFPKAGLVDLTPESARALGRWLIHEAAVAEAKAAVEGNAYGQGREGDTSWRTLTAL